MFRWGSVLVKSCEESFANHTYLGENFAPCLEKKCAPSIVMDRRVPRRAH